MVLTLLLLQTAACVRLLTPLPFLDYFRGTSLIAKTSSLWKE